MAGRCRQNKDRVQPGFRFSLEEAAGAVGDYGTLIPIVCGAAVVSELNLGHILLFFSIWYIITGLYFKLPVPVEPMKAVGAVVIAEGLSSSQITASGMLLGVFFLVLGLSGGMKFIQQKVPRSVIRGIQLGLALILLRTSVRFISVDYVFAAVGVGIIAGFFVLSRLWKIPEVSSLVVLVVGIAAGIYRYGTPQVQLLGIPRIIIPSLEGFLTGSYLLVIPQVPLTITNALLATSLLMADLSGREVSPDKLSVTVGLMNLSGCAFGGFPMCTGAGGLAAQYRFGARTGGSNIISGIILLPVALFFSSPEFLEIVPRGIFGALLVFVAIELGKHGVKKDSYLISIVTAVVGVLTNLSYAFIAGMVLFWVAKKTGLSLFR
ncbi:MAG: putative sulfate/molybdate transporter [Spirochaetota bacterium]